VTSSDRSNVLIQTNYVMAYSTTLLANFITDITSSPVPCVVHFSDISIGSPISWNWSFGDGSVSSFQNPDHVYSVPGNYSVSLNVTNATGSNVTTRTRYITVFPKGDFNGNWRVDIGDVTRVAYMVVGLIPKDPNANFKGYGVVDIADASKIAWYYVGKVAIL